MEDPLTIDDLMRSSLSFPVGTGLGADDISPRAFAELPAQRLQQLADLLNECERIGKWPELWQLVVVVMLSKPDGGTRPIGLFLAAIRL